MNSNSISVSASTEFFALEKVTPELFNSLEDRGISGIIVFPDRDTTRPYYVSWVDKGCDEDGVYYKGFVCKLQHFDGCGHYDGVWFNARTFRESVGKFIREGGDWTLPCNAPTYTPSFGYFS